MYRQTTKFTYWISGAASTWLKDGQDDFYEGDYNGPAFWTQKDVLAWDGYSNPKTLDAYFDLLERYFKAHPTIDGQPTLRFEVHSQDWRSFCLKNAPQHLIGGRNEGDVVVHPDTLKVRYTRTNGMQKNTTRSSMKYSRKA